CTQKAYLDFINPSSPTTPDEEFSGNYKIGVKSMGGLNISGVKVSALLNGKTVAEGISLNGEIELDLEPAEYTLVVDESTLPLGYFMPENVEYKTKADSAKAEVLLSSGIIPTTAVSGTSYAIGDIMYDFSFTDATSGVRYTLSEIHSKHKAVLINFFYTTCGPCRSEFNPMQTAYENYSDDLAIIALADSSKDSSADVAKFRKEFGLTFYMAPDQAGMHNLFGVTSWPTSVMVDRYGAIASYDNSGAITATSAWSGMFAQFTADDYSQSAPDNGNGDNNELVWAKPDAGLAMPSSAEISSAIVGKGSGKISNFRANVYEQDAEFSWPWVLKHDDVSGNDYFSASNLGKGYSFATFYADFALQSGDIIGFDYSVNTEADCDILYVMLVDLNNNMNNQRLADYSGNSGGWKSESALYTANRAINVTLAFLYNKDPLKDAANGEEVAAIKNLRVVNASEIETATDSATSVTSGEVVGGKYQHYETVKLNPADGFYHLYDSENDRYGALVLADILNTTVWSALHVGENSFQTADNTTAATSLYLISYWQMSNYKTAQKDGGLLFDYDNTKDKKISASLISNYYWQTFSDNGYVPVTEDLKAVLVAFTEVYCQKNDVAYYGEQWLEFCYYFIHYGDAHPAGEDCFVTKDPTKGLGKHNALTAVESDDEKLTPNRVNITKIITIDAGGGLFFKFNPSKSGVYRIFTNEATPLIDPLILVRTLEDTENDEFIADFDDDISPDKFVERDNYYYTDVNGYVYLDENTTYYLQCRFNQQQITGSYDYYIKYFAEEYDYLRFATTGDGMWTYNNKLTYYLAIDTALGTDNLYYALNEDGSLGSQIYIDFVHPQYYDENGHSLLEMVEGGLFDFSKTGGANLTPLMMEYYQKSIYGKGDVDELYGMAEADYRLVTYISQYLLREHGEGIETKYWLAFACYYEHIGPNG
ncbi:MAG: TlpA family protein disulfide reductase, partial [Ruminococcus flavefaciens]|nr:TlpA family protein disulfide reductase [Ruminococcus flavefaciens]